MTKIFGLSGSLREGSFNAGLLRAAAEVVPDGTDVIVGTIRGVPLYDGDVEATTEIPAEAQRLKDQLTAADALLLVTPEYNNGVPGVLRNAIDWMTRPASDILGLFGGKPVAVIGASPGGFGTALAQNHWLPVLRRLAPSLGSEAGCSCLALVPSFNDKGDLTDAVIRDNLRKFMAGFAAFVAGNGR
jgi:chromate reductase